MNIYLPDGNSPLIEYKEFADIDFIITDLDGTLIEGDAPVLGQIKRLISKLKKKHTQITVATGRTYYGAEARIKELGVDVGMPVALYNGGVVVEYGTGNILYASYVPCILALKLLEILDLDKVNLYVYCFSLFSPFAFNSRNRCIKEEVYAWGKQCKQQDVNGMLMQHIDIKQIMDLKINAILIDSKNLSLNERRKINDLLSIYNNIKVTDSGNDFIEIKGEGMNKGVIYDILKKHEKFSGKKILAIGDNDNDIELFNGADISVAVANSSPLAFECADYVCESKSAQGFYEMLTVLENAKRYN